MVRCVYSIEVSKMVAAMFVALNVIDAYLTKTALAAGAAEVNLLMTPIGANMIAKGLIATGLVFILYCFQKERALWPLNFMLFGVVLWNSAICWIVTFARLDYIMIGA